MDKFILINYETNGKKEHIIVSEKMNEAYIKRICILNNINNNKESELLEKVKFIKE